jgi:hypothetical protein
MLILTSWAQEQGNEEPLVALPTIKRVAIVHSDFDGHPFEVKIEFTAAPGIRVMGANTAVLARENFDPRVFGDRGPKKSGGTIWRIDYT